MGGNQTQIKFILLGITDSPRAQTPLFVLFLLIYIVTLVGNVGIISLVRVSPSLHTPMYFFLTHFAFMDICYSTVISPRMLADLLSEDKTISFTACMMQYLIFAFFAISECYLLATMAYDRHVAICQPLLYVTIISSRVCWQLVASSYLFAFLSAIIYTWCVFGGSFCGPNRIDHFFCDVVPVLKLVCSDTHSSEMVIFAFVTINVVGTSMFILLSYISIICTVLRMCSAQSRARAFHTCTSHLMAVSLFFGSAFFMYLQPSSSHRSLDKVASIFYAVVTPMLNPFIYSLRNKEVKWALKRLQKILCILVASSYLFAFLSAIAYTWSVFGGSFCGPNRIDHFFCDEVPVLKLVCSDTHSSETVIFAFLTINEVGTIVVILLSYVSIIRTVLRMCSAQSRARAFHTCASHLMAVSMYFGPAFFMYLQPPSSHRSLDKVVSIFYTVVTPMLNPFIYSLRNKEVKGALVKCGRRLFNHRQLRRVLSSRTYIG
ncbi:olfactory receptor 1020-like [Melopsittacus undulatus]|uniref:olfactory receptor 1020-like n=1 Tax=Melopsittacus undulatus TaxID=13146 RepID=UPI00146ACFE0|nr:olfactory receptor 1020-like [Melopsittacus undulatus]